MKYGNLIKLASKGKEVFNRLFSIVSCMLTITHNNISNNI